MNIIYANNTETVMTLQYTDKSAFARNCNVYVPFDWQCVTFLLSWHLHFQFFFNWTIWG